MSWDALFSLTNAIAMIGWLMLALLPRRPLVLSAILYLGVGLLCLAYFAMVAAACAINWSKKFCVTGAMFSIEKSCCTAIVPRNFTISVEPSAPTSVNCIAP